MNARLVPSCSKLPPGSTQITADLLRWALAQIDARGLELLAASYDQDAGWRIGPAADLIEQVTDTRVSIWVGQRRSCRGRRSAIYLCFEGTCIARLTVARDLAGDEPVAWRVLLVEVLYATWFREALPSEAGS